MTRIRRWGELDRNDRVGVIAGLILITAATVGAFTSDFGLVPMGLVIVAFFVTRIASLQSKANPPPRRAGPRRQEPTAGDRGEAE